LKKQMKTKKLSIQRETLTRLQGVTGGLAQSQINDTVYRPAPSEMCATNVGCGNA
jgi:hypothetical protein